MLYDFRFSGVNGETVSFEGYDMAPGHDTRHDALLCTTRTLLNTAGAVPGLQVGRAGHTTRASVI